MELVIATSTEGYFKDTLELSLKRKALAVTEQAKSYLVDLLAKFTRSEVAYAGSDGDREAYVTMLNRASECDFAEAIQIYQQVGDITLVQAGFFSESFHRELVNQDYYISIGESAYSQVSSLTQNSYLRSIVFRELSERFPDLVDVLSCVRVEAHANDPLAMNDSSLFELIELYRKTHNPDILRALQDRGFDMSGEGAAIH